MRSPESGSEVEPEAVADRVTRQLKWFVFALVLLTHVLLVSSIWGRWVDIGIITSVFVGVVGINEVLARRFFSERTARREALRIAINLLITPFYGYVTDWAFPVWLYLVLNGLWVNSSIDKWARTCLLVLLLGVVGCALLDGCPPQVPLTMLLLSVLMAVVSESRVSLTQLTLRSLSQRNEELERVLSELDLAHRRAREQERLSSLGMLAGGIAHELNNPMSYVKSNIHALQQDLKAQKELPPALREYAAEVLPETLEGIKRVCSIVADLRRFARGDPEALIEYDLNEEVQAALRITRGRLQAHCDVEVELENLPPMLGHPSQISQVVINLLVNAAQAMNGRGRVYVSTRSEGEDDVVLTVRDTGVGMPPEVLAQLFEPFFTTRPVGEGTGLGLSVVHGIVTSHGGRIQVESQPGEGSTFTIHLPRVPPLNFISERQESNQPLAEVPVFQGRQRVH